METKDEIFQQLCTIMQDLFEIERADITLDASLYEDLDLDSIDAIDMVVKLQELTGKKVKPEDFKSARQVHDVVDAVYELLQS
ncbi:acyl carrier protein [Oceanicoccus sp. KOV_DT_Chl]|uniref:acyl carrier protein n=1 Tax=Oceanicoccus sp. KOV_DT_Chl TaxID=1904639 RepID=UPI000C7C47B8|nr:acyl carrier protein [Oceanicoccus sp. KOV_DT_Chl]